MVWKTAGRMPRERGGTTTKRGRFPKVNIFVDDPTELSPAARRTSPAVIRKLSMRASQQMVHTEACPLEPVYDPFPLAATDWS